MEIFHTPPDRHGLVRARAVRTHLLLGLGLGLGLAPRFGGGFVFGLPFVDSSWLGSESLWLVVSPSSSSSSSSPSEPGELSPCLVGFLVALVGALCSVAGEDFATGDGRWS